jgi:hypothetical protein
MIRRQDPNRLSNFATTITRNGWGETEIHYHRTTIVKFTNHAFTLNSGGWDTFTTKKKMNQAAVQFNLPYRVYQENFTWLVTIYQNNEPVSSCRFFDGITFVKDQSSDWNVVRA